MRARERKMERVTVALHWEALHWVDTRYRPEERETSNLFFFPPFQLAIYRYYLIYLILFWVIERGFCFFYTYNNV